MDFGFARLTMVSARFTNTGTAVGCTRTLKKITIIITFIVLDLFCHSIHCHLKFGANVHAGARARAAPANE